MVATRTFFNVNGFYDPVAGDFDHDGKDEIFWYAPGTTGDSMWHFQSFTSAIGVPYTVNGSYDPKTGDFNGDGYHDILWYGPGRQAADGRWYFRAGGYTPASRHPSAVFTSLSSGRSARTRRTTFSGTRPDLRLTPCRTSPAAPRASQRAC